VCWIIRHIKCQLFSHKMTSILFWNIKWLFVRFTFCHRTTVTLDTQWQNARTFLERINSRPTLYIYNNILIPYASHLLHTHRPTMEGGRPYYFTHDKYKCLRRDFRHMRNTQVTDLFRQRAMKVVVWNVWIEKSTQVLLECAWRWWRGRGHRRLDRRRLVNCGRPQPWTSTVYIH